MRKPLKEDEKSINLSQENLEELNQFIQSNLDNMRNSTNYRLLHTLSERMINGMNVENVHFDAITTFSSKEQTQKIALDFFKSLDNDFYDKAKAILEGKSDIKLHMYKLDEKLENYPAGPCLTGTKNNSAIFLPYKGTVEDIYWLVHEISHTFDYANGNTHTRNMLSEITSSCFEAMLGKYLSENKVVSKEDVKNKELRSICSHYYDGIETFTKLELMRLKHSKGDITQNDLISFQEKYKLSNKRTQNILNRFHSSPPYVDYRARYMIGQLVYPHFMEKYEENPAIALDNLKQYFKEVEKNNFASSLEKLDVSPNLDNLDNLLDANNRRIQQLCKSHFKSLDMDKTR